MYRLTIDQLKPGLIIKQPVYDPNYNMMIKKNTKLNEHLIDSIVFYGYRALFVDNDETHFLTIEHFEKKWPKDEMEFLLKYLQDAYKDLENYFNRKQYNDSVQLFKKYAKRRDESILKLTKIAEDIIVFLMHNQVKALHILETKSIPLYTYQHAIQTAIISSLMGIRLKLSMTEIKILLLSSLIMEISNVTIPKHILFKEDSLSDGDFNEIKKHTFVCYEEFSDCTPLHYLVKLVCLQHHEKYDGSGYPKGLKGEEIHFLARLISVADSFDALISDRSQRSGYSIPEALKILESQSNITYSKDMVDLLKSVIYPYSIGEQISLNIGKAIVVGYDEDTNPILEILHLKKKIILHPNSTVSPT